MEARQAAIKNVVEICSERLALFKQDGIFQQAKVLNSPTKSEIMIQGKKVLNFRSNNFLDLCNNERIKVVGKKTLDKYGFGLNSPRPSCGTQDIQKELEDVIAKFHKTDLAMVYSSHSGANFALFSTILSEQDVIISDELIFPTVADGIRLSKAKNLVYKHLDMEDLEAKLKETENYRFRLIASDGVFPLNGNIVPLPKVMEIAKKYDAYTFLDDCHGTGVFGKTGGGTPEHFGLEGQVDILHSTFGKSLGGGTGGYSTGKKEIIELLRQTSNYSCSLGSPIIGATLECFRMLNESTELVDNLRRNTQYFRKSITKLGFKTFGHEFSPIVAILLGEDKLSTHFEDELFNNGIFATGLRYPDVPSGESRIKVQLTAGHSKEQINKALEVLSEIGRASRVIN